MIAVVLRIGYLRLWHNRLELALAFCVPLVFFSIFAVICGGHLGRSLTAVQVAVVDEDRTDFSRQVVADLESTPGMNLVRATAGAGDDRVLTVDGARRLVQQGQAAVGVVLPAGLAEAVTGGGTDAAVVELLADSSEPVASQVVAGRLREAVMVRQGGLLARQGARKARAGVLAARLLRPRPAADEVVEPSEAASADPAAAGEEETRASEPAGWSLDQVDVLGGSQANPAVTMFAAGIAVLFLLFSTTSAAGTLLEEAEAGTLERLLTSRLTLGQLLAGKWLWTVGLASAQTTVMFVWAWLVFGVDLPGRIPGFVVMTICTSAAAASLALCLATLCRTRQQLAGISTIVILSMSALGGSMVPRYVMSESLQRAGLITFNAWALDGFNKVFWRQLPVTALGPQVGVLLTTAVVLFALARWQARRWQPG